MKTEVRDCVVGSCYHDCYECHSFAQLGFPGVVHDSDCLADLGGAGAVVVVRVLLPFLVIASAFLVVAIVVDDGRHHRRR